MIKTWYEEYEKIKDKAVVVYGYEWESMADEQKERILAEKTVIMSGDSGYACKRYQIIGNANNLSDLSLIHIQAEDKETEYASYEICRKSKVGEYIQAGQEFFVADMKKKKIYSSNVLRLRELSEKVDSEDTFVFKEATYM